MSLAAFQHHGAADLNPEGLVRETSHWMGVVQVIIHGGLPEELAGLHHQIGVPLDLIVLHIPRYKT